MWWHELTFDVGPHEHILEFLQCFIVHTMCIGFVACSTEVDDDAFMHFSDLIKHFVLDGDGPDWIGIMCAKIFGFALEDVVLLGWIFKCCRT